MQLTACKMCAAEVCSRPGFKTLSVDSYQPQSLLFRILGDSIELDTSFLCFFRRPISTKRCTARIHHSYPAQAAASSERERFFCLAEVNIRHNVTSMQPLYSGKLRKQWHRWMKPFKFNMLSVKHSLGLPLAFL